MKYNILMDVIDNISKYSTKNVQMIDIDIIIHSFKKKKSQFYSHNILMQGQTAINQNITAINGIT